MRSSKVFLSYIHDKEHDGRILALADRLRADGIDALIDQYESAPTKGWTRWVRDGISDADFVLVVCTEGYGLRAEGRSTPDGKGHGVNREGQIIDQYILRVWGRQ